MKADTFKEWATPVGSIVAAITLLWGVISFGLQQQSSYQNSQDQQQEAILQTYIDDIQNLIHNDKLGSPNSNNNAADIARVRTLTTLRSLKDGRNSIIMQFLQEAHLIGINNSVINLSNADLTKIDLSNVDLKGTNLSSDNLSGANLEGADLSGANLYNADLYNADLYNADLSETFLSIANLSNTNMSNAHMNGAILTGASLGSTYLHGASLNNAILNGADLNNANLVGAQLDGTNLIDSILSRANLSGASLDGANLSGADVSYAYMKYADLSNTDMQAKSITQSQLDSVYSCTKIHNLPKGLTCNHLGSPITLTYWYTESSEETPVILNLIKQFEDDNSGIKINAMPETFSNAQAAFINASQSGNAPDILRSDVTWISGLASQHYLLNLDSYISQRDLADYQHPIPNYPSPLDFNKYNGHLYGLPQVTDFLALMYNKNEFYNAGIHCPPTTMGEFENDARKIISTNTEYGFETDGLAYDALPFLWAFGGGMLGQHNQPLVNNGGSVTGLNFLLKLQIHDKVMPQQINFSPGKLDTISDFKNGNTAMVFGGPYDILRILKGTAFRADQDKLGIAAIPMGTTPKGSPLDSPRSPIGGQSYVISAGTQHPYEAYQFISFMSSKENQIAIALANHTLPTRQSVYSDPQIKGDRFIHDFILISNRAISRPNIPQGGHLFDVFDPNIQAALDGTEDPQAALDAVAGAWKQILPP